MAALIRPAVLEQGDAARFLSLSVATVERLVRTGVLPKPRQLSEKRVGYLVRELEEWLEARPVSDLLPPKNTNRKAKAVLPRTAQGESTAS